MMVKRIFNSVYLKETKFTTRGRAVAARVAHNHKVAGSSPAPATKTSARLKRRVFVLVTKPGLKTATLKRSQVKSAIRHFARKPSG